MKSEMEELAEQIRALQDAAIDTRENLTELAYTDSALDDLVAVLDAENNIAAGEEAIEQAQAEIVFEAQAVTYDLQQMAENLLIAIKSSIAAQEFNAEALLIAAEGALTKIANDAVFEAVAKERHTQMFARVQAAVPKMDGLDIISNVDQIRRKAMLDKISKAATDPDRFPLFRHISLTDEELSDVLGAKPAQPAPKVWEFWKKR